MFYEKESQSEYLRKKYMLHISQFSFLQMFQQSAFFCHLYFLIFISEWHKFLMCLTLPICRKISQSIFQWIFNLCIKMCITLKRWILFMLMSVCAGIFLRYSLKLVLLSCIYQKLWATWQCPLQNQYKFLTTELSLSPAPSYIFWSFPTHIFHILNQNSFPLIPPLTSPPFPFSPLLSPPTV